MRRQLSEYEPQSEAAPDSEHDRIRTGSDRYPERHQQRTRCNDEGESRHSGDTAGQHEEHSTGECDDRRHTECEDSTLATQLGAIGSDTERNRHVRNVIRPSHFGVAIWCCVAARVGGEVVARSSVVAGGVGVAAAMVPWRIAWWLGIALVLAMRFRSTSPHRWLVALVLLTVVHGAVEWHRLATPRVGEFSGYATARTDTSPRGIIVEVEGERFRLTLYGSERNRIRNVKMGDHLLLDAHRVAYDARRLRFVAGRHVQGELRDVTVHATLPARTPWYRAANRIHELVDRGTRTVHHDDAALIRGFVLGDESRQPERMTEAFRAAGLGHLLAVSGQNVVIVLAALTPALRRLSRWWRLSGALGVIAMFAITTRLESSVVRAAVMAALVQVGFAIGRDLSPLRALAWTVMLIVGVDPLATWSVGFVLSVAATAGLIVITPHVGTSNIAASIAAQLGVAPFVLWWFGSMPIVALPANVLAVPVASLVMMCAPPLLVAAAFLPDAVASLVVAPVVAAIRWVWWVAELGRRAHLPTFVNLGAWGVVLATIGWRLRHRCARLVGCRPTSSPVTTSD